MLEHTSKPLNGQRAIRYVMFHRVDDRIYILAELESGRLVWFW